MKSPLQKPETGKIRSMKGHAEPVTRGQNDYKNEGSGGSQELHGEHRPFPQPGHNDPASIGAPMRSTDGRAADISDEIASKRRERAGAMDAAHARGKKDITPAANELPTPDEVGDGGQF